MDPPNPALANEAEPFVVRERFLAEIAPILIQ